MRNLAITSRWFTLQVIAVGLLGIAVADDTLADERLKGIACRSVHLNYRAEPSVAFYNEVLVTRSAPGTFFVVCGWNKGYFGIQELGNRKKVALFSVWDSKQNDPSAVKEDLRAKVIHKHDKVRARRFGGEGTGGQAFFDYDWQIGQRYHFVVTAEVDTAHSKPKLPRTQYAGHFYDPKQKEWLHLVTFSTITDKRLLARQYSFVEDFRRNRVSTTHVRQAMFGNGWVLPPNAASKNTESGDTNGNWRAITEARFTADRNPVTNIDAGALGPFFYLTTGGKTRNTHAPLGSLMRQPFADSRRPPGNLPPALSPKTKS